MNTKPAVSRTGWMYNHSADYTWRCRAITTLQSYPRATASSDLLSACSSNLTPLPVIAVRPAVIMWSSAAKPLVPINTIFTATICGLNASHCLRDATSEWRDHHRPQNQYIAAILDNDKGSRARNEWACHCCHRYGEAISRGGGDRWAWNHISHALNASSDISQSRRWLRAVYEYVNG